MKKSFISILLLTLVMVLAISAVSATEDIDASNLAIQSLDETPVDDGLMADIEEGNNFTSLQSLVDSKDEIVLEKDYTRVGDDKDIVIDKSVKIVGSGIKIDANGLGGIFNVTENGVLTLKGISLENGNGNLGGVIYNSGTVNVDNCIFSDNVASVGGAIYICSNGVVDLTYSIFNDNVASNYGDDIYNEGKLLIANNVLNVSDIYNLGEIKNSTDLEIFAFVNNYGCIIINATIDKKATGNVVYKIFSSNGLLMGEKEVPIEDGVIEQYSELTPFTKGNYTIVVSYTGDENYADKEVEGTVEVTKSLVNVSHSAIVTGGEVNVTIDLGVDATGVVHLVFPSGYVENITLVDGKANFYDAYVGETGYITLVADYDGDANYYGFYEYYIDFFIKYDPYLTVASEVNEYGMIVINATINNTATGEITFVIYDSNDEVAVNVTKVVENGAASFDELAIFEKGFYTFEVDYSGDDLFESAVYGIGEANVTKTAPILDVYNVSVNDYGMIVVLANINKGATGNVTYLFTDVDSGRNLTVDIPVDEDGNANFDELTSFEKGYYSINVWYKGDESYYATIDSITEVNVTKTAPILDVYSVSVNDYGMIVVLANINKGATGYVTYLFTNVDTGKNLTVDIPVDEDGNANYDELATFDKGYYSINVWYNGDDSYYATTDFITEANVTKSFVNVTHTVVVAGGEVNVTVDLGVNATGVIHVVYPSGYVDNVTIVDGKANFYEVFIAETGDISLVVDYDGDDNYYGFYGYYIDFIIQKATFIKAKSISVVYQNNAKWTITLVDADNKPVTNVYISVSVNGKTYKAKTNSNGKAVVTIPAKLVPKAYATKITFAGTTYYSSDYENSLKFTVKKATPKLTAKKKTFKVKKSKKYTVTLKTNKNKSLNKVKVTITIKAKGKKIKITRTTKNGKATFNLKKLTKKGGYTALVKFAGNKYYKAVSKKARIIVK